MERISNSRCGLKFLALLLLTCFSIVVSDPIKHKDNNMLEAIVSSCPTVKFLQDSAYVAGCKGVPYSTEPKETDDSLALCMAVKDIANKICMYSSVVITGNDYKVQLPIDAKDFDTAVKKLEPKEKEFRSFMTNLCKNMPLTLGKLNSLNIQTEVYLINYIKYVNDTLLTRDSCPFTCLDIKKKVNPLCMVYLWAGELFSKMKPLKEKKIDNENIPSQKEVTESVVLKTIEQSVVQPEKEVKIGEKPAKTLLKDQTSHVVRQDDHVELSSSNGGTEKLNKPKTKLVDEKPVDKKVDGTSTGKIEKADEKKIDETSKGNVENTIEKGLDKIVKQKEEEVPHVGPEVADNPKQINPEEHPASIDETSLVDPKQGETNENFPPEVNPDEFNPGEEEPSRKGNGNDPEESNENMETEIKGYIKSHDDGSFMPGNIGDTNMLSQGERKFVQHPSITKEEEESHFFTYFSIVSLMCVVLYIGFHNKQKILAMLLEGRRSRRGRGSRRRPSTASYRKLDSNLEEAVTSQCSSNVTHVIY